MTNAFHVELWSRYVSTSQVGKGNNFPLILDKLLASRRILFVFSKTRIFSLQTYNFTKTNILIKIFFYRYFYAAYWNCLQSAISPCAYEMIQLIQGAFDWETVNENVCNDKDMWSELETVVDTFCTAQKLSKWNQVNW